MGEGVGLLFLLLNLSVLHQFICYSDNFLAFLSRICKHIICNIILVTHCKKISSGN